MKLTAKQRAFIEAYTDPESPGFDHGTKAAIIAGYSERGAHVAASRLLHDIKITERIARRRQMSASDADFNREKAIRMAVEMAESWQKAKMKAPPPACVKALELAAKIAGHAVDRLEHTGKDGGPIQTEVSPLDDLTSRIARLAGTSQGQGTSQQLH